MDEGTTLECLNFLFEMPLRALIRAAGPGLKLKLSEPRSS